MSRLSHLASVKAMPTASFTYTPPLCAFDAVRVIVRAALPQVSQPVLAKVLRGLRRANPGGRVIVLVSADGDTSPRGIYEASGLEDLLDGNMQAIDVNSLGVGPYANRLPQPQTYRSVLAPTLLDEVDCRISLSAVTPGDLAAVRALYGLIPAVPQHNTGLTDLYFTLGLRFDGAVVEAGDRVFWGDELLAVDEAALRHAGADLPPVLADLRRLCDTL